MRLDAENAQLLNDSIRGGFAGLNVLQFRANAQTGELFRTSTLVE